MSKRKHKKQIIALVLTLSMFNNFVYTIAEALIPITVTVSGVTSITDNTQKITKTGEHSIELKNIAAKDETKFASQYEYIDKDGYLGIIPRTNIEWATNHHVDEEKRTVQKSYTVKSKNVPETVNIKETVNGKAFEGDLPVKDVNYTVTKNEYLPIYKVETKEFTEQLTKSHQNVSDDSLFPEQYNINKDGYVGTIPRTDIKWTGEGQIYTKEYSTSSTSYDNNFPYIRYYRSSDGYSGYLTKDGGSYVASGSAEDSKTVYEEETGDVDKVFPETKSYNDRGYSGTLYKYRDPIVISGVEGKSKQVTDYSEYIYKSPSNIPLMKFYNDGIYKGYLLKTTSDKKEVVTQPASTKEIGPRDFFVVTYAGHIVRYIYTGNPKDGGYTHVNAPDSFGNTHPYWVPKGWKYSVGQVRGSYPKTYFYNKDGYTGTLTYSQVWKRLTIENDGKFPTNPKVGQVYTIGGTTSEEIYYSGTVSRPEKTETMYRGVYSGTVRSNDTRVFKQFYKGEVVKPDTRIWGQDYSGTITKSVGDYNGVATYSGTLEKKTIEKYDTIPVEWKADVVYEGSIKHPWEDYNGTASYSGEVSKLVPIINVGEVVLKQNRTVTFTLTNSVTSVPVDNSKTEFTITPASSAITADKIKTKVTGNKVEAVFKEPGDYTIKAKISNGKVSGETEFEITVKPDEKPVANFNLESELITRNPEDNSRASIKLFDASSSPDGDKIAKRVWKYKHDSNNDGMFGDEVWQTISATNETEVLLKVPKVGKYLVELEIQEEFGEATIAEFITSADRLTADTYTSKPMQEKIFEVDNIAPYVDFSVAPKQKADIVFTLGNVAESKTQNLNTKIANIVKAKLNAKNIDADIETIETSAQNVQNSFNWQQDVHSNVGSISFQNNGSTINMRGNTYTNGFNKIYTNNPDSEITKQKMSFSYNLNYGDSFDGAGVLLNTNVENGNLNGYALMFMQGGNAKLFKLNNWSSSASEEIYLGSYWSNRINSKATYIGSIPMGNSGSYTIETTNKKLTVIKNGSSIGSIDLPEHYGWGFGFFSDHYSHGCDSIGQFALNNISLEITKGKSFDEVIKQPEWRDNSTRFLVNLNDKALLGEGIPDENKLASILSQLTDKDIYFVGMGNNTNKEEMETIINGTGKGKFIDNANIDTALNGLADYIISQMMSCKEEYVEYILLGEDIEYTTYYDDYENDPEVARQWKYSHNANYFENSLGQIPYHNEWIPNPTTSFDKVGEYTVVFEAKDDPTNKDNRFTNYRKWSQEPEKPMKIYVHRKPIAQFVASAVPQGSVYKATVRETSYDLDHQSQSNKGVVEKEWKWKIVTDASWTNGQLPSTLQLDKNYILQLRVKDVEGVWSDPAVQFITTKNINLPPVAQFSVSPNPLPISKALAIKDESYDPNGDSIAQYSWILEKNGTKVYEGASLPTNYNVSQYGIGKYKATLKVRDNPRVGGTLWSEPYSQAFEVIPDNRKPIANFTVTPNPVPTDVNVSYNETSSDPDGDPIVLKEWQVKKSGTLNWVAVSEPPINFESYGVGTHSIRLRVKDQPSLPQLDPLWSDWKEVNVQVIAGNQKPVSRFTVSPNPVPADEPVTYKDTSYDPEGKKLTDKVWQVKNLETNNIYEFSNQLPPTVFEETGWGANGDGVGTYEITLKVKDTSPNGLSPARWSDEYKQTLVVEDPLRITALSMTSIVNPPKGTTAPVIYPVSTPTKIKAGYKMTFKVATNGGDKIDIKLYANGMPLTVHTDDGDTNTITKATVRKNATTSFSFWTDKDLPKGTVIDMKIILTKTKGDGTTKSLVNNELGNRFGIIVGSSKEDSSINLTH